MVKSNCTFKPSKNPSHKVSFIKKMHVGRRSAVTNWTPQSETRHRYHRRQSTGPVAWYITEYYRSPRQTFGWDYLHREYIFTKTFIYNQYCLLQHCKIIHLISLITSIHLKQKKNSWPQNSLDKIKLTKNKFSSAKILFVSHRMNCKMLHLFSPHAL